MIGENFVTLTGNITRPNFKLVGQNNTPLLKGSMSIPTARGTNQYIKIAAWGDLAESLNGVPPQAFIKVHGHVEESSYDGKCRHCQGPDKKYWTEVVIDNYMIVTEEVV